MTVDKTSKGVFDISTAEGVNESERLLMRLCRRSFLSLWSHANLHTDQDMRQGKGSAKEFADVLVVFGNDIVIFSDKHVTFQQDKPLQVAWARWYKRAVAESAKQLHGAMNWLIRFPSRVYLDSQCTRALPVRVPPPEAACFHLVAVTRGSFEACAKHFPGSLGTLQIKTDVVGRQHEDNPFVAGIVSPGKEFVHVFDEFSLEVVMSEMDTVTDFVDYLRSREDFLSSTDTRVIAAGEEQLVSAYLVNGDESGRSFLPVSARGKKPDIVVFDESHFDALHKRPEYVAKKRLDRRSYAWDKIIERFIQVGDPALVAPNHTQLNEETEEALRLIAGESRFRRRLLVDAFFGLLTAAENTGRRRARLFTTDQEPAVVYVFLTMPKELLEAYDDYRRLRVALLYAYCRCAKLRCPEGTTFIGLATDHPDKDYQGSSEDLVVYFASEFDEGARADVHKQLS